MKWNTECHVCNKTPIIKPVAVYLEHGNGGAYGVALACAACVAATTEDDERGFHPVPATDKLPSGIPPIPTSASYPVEPVSPDEPRLKAWYFPKESHEPPDPVECAIATVDALTGGALTSLFCQVEDEFLPLVKKDPKFIRTNVIANLRALKRGQPNCEPCTKALEIGKHAGHDKCLGNCECAEHDHWFGMR